MTLDDTIAKSIKDYPSLFKDVNWERSRLKVLDHLFLVNGNGYEWYDGYLTSRHDENAKSRKLKKYQKEKFPWRPDQKWFDEKISRYFEEISLYDPRPYPPCIYSQAFTAPDNIRPDWLAGAIETVKWAIEFYDGPTEQVVKSGVFLGANITTEKAKEVITERVEMLWKTLNRLNLLEKTSQTV